MLVLFVGALLLGDDTSTNRAVKHIRQQDNIFCKVKHQGSHTRIHTLCSLSTSHLPPAFTLKVLNFWKFTYNGVGGSLVLNVWNCTHERTNKLVSWQLKEDEFWVRHISHSSIMYLNIALTSTKWCIIDILDKHQSNDGHQFGLLTD